MPHEESGAGLNYIAFVDRVADMERHRDPVAHHGDVADDFFNSADGVGRSGRLGLRILSGRGRAGQQFDKVAGNSCAVWRHQRRRMLNGKIAGNNVMMAVVAGQDKVWAFPFKMPSEQQFRIGNADDVRVTSVGGDYGWTNAVTTLRRRRASH